MLAVAFLAGGWIGGQTTVTLNKPMSHCSATPMLIEWTGTYEDCVSTLVNGTLNGVILTFTSATPANWVTETVSLSTVAAGATTLAYTTKMTPAGGLIVAWYQSANIGLNMSLPIAFTGNPITFALPSGWSPGDSYTVLYQVQ